MKSVCIVGAGPAGLVSAKVLLESGQFAVKVYEKKDRVGGIWALDEASTTGFIGPHTPANLSRFTVAFCDLDWRSVNLRSETVRGRKLASDDRNHVPMFPPAWMLNRYLESYRTKYIPDDVIACNQEVVGARRSDESWVVSTRSRTGAEASQSFDYLLIASGFFAQPRSIQQDVPDLVEPACQLSIPVLHSASFRNLDDLFPPDGIASGKDILVIGGGISSGETAAAVAMQLSHTQWSPDRGLAARFRNCKVIHLTPRAIYPLPLFLEYEVGSRSYMPLDFKLYDLGKRPQDLASYAGGQTSAGKDRGHSLLQGVVGGDQSDISEALVSPQGTNRSTTHIALAETYAEFVRSSLIQVVCGRVSGIQDTNQGLATASVQQKEGTVKVSGIGAVVHATGYTPSPALDILDDETKAALHHDATSMRLPVLLNQWQTMNENVPTLSFVGFYQGPYWPMIEMQARLTVHRWLTGRLAPRKSYETTECLQEVRRAMKQKSLDIPQFWFPDYLGYMEDMAGELEMKGNLGQFSEREGCVFPARYVDKHTTMSQAEAMAEELNHIWKDCMENGRFVARAAFRALQGDWEITREIQSAIPTFPSGTLKGTASFHPRYPTLDSNEFLFDREYLYVESGTFTTSTGVTMKASRRYVYRYCEASDQLSVWFVKVDNDLAVDYRFHDLAFVKPSEARKEGALVATAEHLCVDDMYRTHYRLPMRGVSLPAFAVTHTVKGPSKDYIATTRYERRR